MLSCFLWATLLVSYVYALSLPISSSGPVQPLESSNPSTSIIVNPSTFNATNASDAAANSTTDLADDQLTAGSSICLPKARDKYHFALPRPKFNHCALALRQLSSDATVENFCTVPARAPQGCSIPITKTVETCTITVQLVASGRIESASWLEIGMAANQLNMGCFSLDDSWKGTTGGRTTAGKTSGIEIKLDNSGNAAAQSAPVF